MLSNKKAQSTLEYAVVIAVVVGALIAIQIYMKRGVQGKLRESADQVGEQFEASDTEVDITTDQTGTTIQTTTTDGVTRVQAVSGSQKESGTETVAEWKK